nr:hypothetical protein [Escherichia coli]
MNIYALSGILYGMDISALTTTNDIEKLRAMALAMVQKAMSENAEKERELQAKSQRIRKRLVRTVLIFTESSDQLSRATDRVP